RHLPSAPATSAPDETIWTRLRVFTDTPQRPPRTSGTRPCWRCSLPVHRTRPPLQPPRTPQQTPPRPPPLPGTAKPPPRFPQATTAPAPRPPLPAPRPTVPPRPPSTPAR